MRIPTNIEEHRTNFIEVVQTYADRLYIYKPTGGPGFHVDCKAMVEIGEKESIIIIKDHDNLDSYNLSAIESGIQKFINDLSKLDIGLKGFVISFYDHVFHSVDSKPICYSIAVQMFLWNLIESKCVRNICYDYSSSSNKCSIISTRVSYKNLLYHQVQTEHIPSTFEKNLFITSNLLIDTTGNEDRRSLSYNIEPLNKIMLGSNRITFRALNDEIGSLSNYLKVARTIIEELNAKQKSLCGMIIYVSLSERNEYKSDISEKEAYIFGWQLRGVINDEKLVIVK